MPNGTGDSWVTIETRTGPVQVRAGSFIASVTDPTSLEKKRVENIDQGTMDWSLGEFADLLWMLVPEARGIIVEHACAELRSAARDDAFLARISEYSIAGDLHIKVLRPALNGPGEQTDVVRRCLAVMHRLLLEDDGNYYWDVFNIEILSPLISLERFAGLAAINREFVDFVQAKYAEIEGQARGI